MQSACSAEYSNVGGMLKRQGLVFNNIVPTVAMKARNFSRIGLPRTYDPLTLAGGARTQFPDNVIPNSRISPQAQFFNKFIPDPNTAVGTAAFAPASSLNTDRITARFDRRTPVQLHADDRESGGVPKPKASTSMKLPTTSLGIKGRHICKAGGKFRYWHFYGQDDVKLGKRLTLNLGLRNEYSRFLNGYVLRTSSQAGLPQSITGNFNYFSQDASSTYHSKAMRAANTPSVGGNTACEKALVGFDRPNRLVLSTGWELPVEKGRAILTNSPRAASGTVSNPTLDVWFDKAAFTVPANFTYGNSGANILREGGFKRLDFSIFKQFQVTDGSRLQCRAEFFNVTDTAGFQGPNTDIDVAAGGRVTATANTPRQIQFALKYTF